MHTFVIKPNSFKELRKAILVRMIPLCATIILILVVMRGDGPSESGQVDTWLPMIFIMGGIFVFSIYTSLKRQKKIFESFKLTISADQIIREQFNTPDIAISRTSVKEIIRGKNGAFAVIGESKLNAIVIPAQIDRPDELTRLLSEIKPVTIKTATPWWQKFLFPLVLVGMVVLFWGLTAENIFLFSISGIGVLALVLLGFIVIHRSKNVDRRMKRMSYIFLIPFLSILTVVIMKWLEM